MVFALVGDSTMTRFLDISLEILCVSAETRRNAAAYSFNVFDSTPLHQIVQTIGFLWSMRGHNLLRKYLGLGILLNTFARYEGGAIGIKCLLAKTNPEPDFR